jgi:tetratricopeptide (TPR) repeat protein
LSPGPFDAAMAKAARGYGLVKAGEGAAGTSHLAESVEWFNRSQMRFTRCGFAIWLGDAYLRQEKLAEARAVLEEVLATSRDAGYRHLEGIAHRLLGESLASQDPPAAAQHLEAALPTLREVGARNEVAKTLVAQAGLARAAGNIADARQLLEEALALFESLGTMDGPPRVRAMLAVLGGKGRRLLIVSRSHRDVYQQLGRDLAGEHDIQVVLDRREGEPQAEDRRILDSGRADRGSRPDLDAAIRSLGYGILTEDSGA